MGRNTLKARLSRTGLWFCLPQLIGFLFVFLCPLALCVYYSMTAKSGGFSGLANYRDLWNSGTFRLALGNTFRFSAVGVLLLVGISFLLSVGFHHLLLPRAKGIGAAQKRLNFCKHYLYAERFRNEIIRSQLNGHNQIHIVSGRR